MVPNILPLLRLETFPRLFGLTFFMPVPSPQSKLQALTPIDYVLQHFLDNHRLSYFTLIVIILKQLAPEPRTIYASFHPLESPSRWSRVLRRC